MQWHISDANAAATAVVCVSASLKQTESVLGTCLPKIAAHTKKNYL